MKITGRVETEAVVDVSCDVCGSSTRLETGSLQYGVLHAHWGFGALHDGERYEVHLCEPCFFQTIAYLKQERRITNMLKVIHSSPRMTSASLPGMTFSVMVTDLKAKLDMLLRLFRG